MSPASNAEPTSTYQTIRCLDSLAPGAELASSSSDSSQKYLLLKLPRQQLQDLPQLQQLVQQSVALRHPNVLQVHELYLTSQHLVVVQEGCSDCSLAQFLQQRRQQGRQLSEAAARCLFQQVVIAMDYCHRQGLTGLPIQHILLQEQPRFNSGWMGYDWMYAADIRSSSSSSSSKTELWAAEAPWAYMLQLLCDVAAALVDLHSLQPPLTHGAANAGAVHLLSAPPCATHARQLQNASTADSLIPQQQQQVAQLSWVGPWRHAVSSSRQLSHPVLTAPEVLMHGAPFSAATDVYGFGMIMLQLAACWAPAEHELGSTDSFRDIDSSLRVLQQHGTLLAAVESQQVFDGWRQQLPAGYWQLARSCCSGHAADRPSAEEALRRCSALAEALRPA
ncbi:hypothetical protein OEZ86_009144 [Tetradesmus obliquus]|nr:hypothetical protein OEZ86_009144 [Tetradesmus obliquus]